MSRIFDQVREAEQEKKDKDSAKPPARDSVGPTSRKSESRSQSLRANPSARLPIFIRLKIKGNDMEGQLFEEDSRTIVIAKHSILITMTHRVSLGAEVSIENLLLGRSSIGRVAWQGGETNEVGVYLPNSEEMFDVKLGVET